MTGILPDSINGGVVIRNSAGIATNPANTPNAYAPPATFTSSCELTALSTDCNARWSPAQQNAIVSELLCLAATMNVNGTWDCTSLCNLASAFQAWAASATASGPSLDAGNLLDAGTDGKPYLSQAKFMASAIAP
jgi:hypothetical protein